MKYVFFGTPEFAAIILEKLVQAGMPPSLVITNPDKPTGRKQVMIAPPVKKIAEKYNIPILQPVSLKGLNYELRITNYDAFVVAAYGKLIPKEVLEIPRLGTINVHPSLLPKYRGPTPIQTAILNGDEVTGVSIMRLDEEIDHGPILAQRELSNYKLLITNYQLLTKQLAELGAEMLIDVLPKYVAGTITPIPQDHAKATFTKKFTTADAEILIGDLRDTLDGDAEKAERIDRMVRALNPEPGIWTRTDDSPPSGLPKNKRVKILESEIRNGKLILKKIQVEGQKPRSL